MKKKNDQAYITHHTRLLALKRFPTTDEITKLFIFASSLTARVEKIVMRRDNNIIVLLHYVCLSTIDANNFFNPSAKCCLDGGEQKSNIMFQKL